MFFFYHAIHNTIVTSKTTIKIKKVNTICSALTSGFKYVVIEIIKSRNTKPVKIPSELIITSRNKSLTVFLAAMDSTKSGITN